MKHDDTSKLVRQVIAHNVRKLRKRTGQSQVKFAKMVSINRSYISQIENGKMNVSVDILVKIADGLDVPLASLLKGLEGAPPCKLPKDTVYAVIALEDPDRKRR